VIHGKITDDTVPLLGHHLVPVLGVRERLAQAPGGMEPLHSVVGLLLECELLRFPILRKNLFSEVFLLIFSSNLLLEPEQLVQRHQVHDTPAPEFSWPLVDGPGLVEQLPDDPPFDQLRFVQAAARIFRVESGVSPGGFGAGPAATVAAAPVVALLLVPLLVFVAVTPRIGTGTAVAGFTAAALPLFLLPLPFVLVAPALFFPATFRRASALLTKIKIVVIFGVKM